MIVLGDDVYQDPWKHYTGGKGMEWGLQIETYRSDSVQGMCPKEIWGGAPERPNPALYGPAKKKFNPNGLYIREKNMR